MASLDLAERVALLETEVKRLKTTLNPPATQRVPWWEQIIGTFADDPDFEEAVALGQQYRIAQRPDSAATNDDHVSA